MAINAYYNGISIGNVGQKFPAFAYSANVLEITRVTSVSEVNVTVSDLNTAESVTLTQQFYSSTLNIDISRMLRAFGTEVEVAIVDENNTLSFSLYVINGALPALGKFGGIYSVRRWEGLPFTVDFLALGSVAPTVTKPVTGTIETLSPPTGSMTLFNLYSYWPTGVSFAIERLSIDGKGYVNGQYSNVTWTYNIAEGCRVPDKEELYLRWVDTQGLQWYWLAQINEATIKTSSSLTIGRMVLRRAADVDEWNEESQKVTSRSLSVGIYNLTDDEYKVVRTLFSSVLVDAYDEDSGRWYRVRIGDGELTEVKKGHYRDIELTIELPPVTTQLP